MTVSEDLRIEFDRLFLAAVRGGATTSSVQIQQCLIACVNALRAILSTQDLWILALGSQSGVERDWLVQAFYPSDPPDSLRLCLGRSIEEAFPEGQQWIYRVPMYSTKDARLSYSEYRLLVPKTRETL